MKRLIPLVAVLVVVVGGVVLFWLLTGGPQKASQDQIGVAVSVPPQASFVKGVGGERVRVTVMVPPGKSPATYEPTSQQIQQLSTARLYVRVGHPLFPFERAWLNKIVAQHPQLKVIDFAHKASLIPDDSHVWLSPRLVSLQVKAIGQALAHIDPPHAAYYQANAHAFRQKIKSLIAWLQQTLQPIKGRKFLVYHPAWGYFARDFGLQQIALEQDHKEPGAHDLKEFIEQARQGKHKVVFVQQQFDTRQANLLAKSIRGRVVRLNPLARDWMKNLKETARTFVSALQRQNKNKEGRSSP